MTPRSDFVTHMQSQLKQWDTDVAALVEEGKKASAQARTQYDEGLKGLRASRDAAQKSFQQICVSSGDAATQLHAGMEGAWTTMRTGLETLMQDLKK
jgi:hypothetical protein